VAPSVQEACRDMKASYRKALRHLEAIYDPRQPKGWMHAFIS
jgi:molybdenum-dependent DNA-binding transcriptional regulator ModE